MIKNIGGPMKKGFKFACAAIVLTAFFSSCTVNKMGEVSRSLTTEGTASVSAKADIATVEFTLLTAGWSAKQIVTDNNTLSGRLRDSIKAIGVNETDIVIGDCSITNPAQQYEARRSIVVTVRNLELLPAIIDCKTGAIKLKSVTYDLTDSASATRRARSQAVQQAQDAASLLAGASGCKLGQVTSISEIKTEKTADASGNITTTSTVLLSYTIQ